MRSLPSSVWRGKNEQPKYQFDFKSTYTEYKGSMGWEEAGKEKGEGLMSGRAVGGSRQVVTGDRRRCSVLRVEHRPHVDCRLRAAAIAFMVCPGMLHIPELAALRRSATRHCWKLKVVRNHEIGELNTCFLIALDQ